MNRRIILILLLISSFFSLEARAQRRGDMAIGKVNLYAVLLLHPAMIDYDTEAKAFLAQRDAVSQQKYKNEQSSNSNDIKMLEEHIRKLRARIAEEDKKYANRMTKLTTDHTSELVGLATGPAAVSEIEYKKNKKKEEDRYAASIGSLYGEIQIAEKKIEKLTRSGFGEGHTTPDETYRRFEAIFSETNSYIKRIAEQKGISVVLNSGYKRLFRQFDSRITDFNIPIEQSLRGIVKGPVQETLNRDPDALRGYYEYLNSRTVSWLDNAGSILRNVESGFVNSDIIVGGYDLTGEVLTALYKAYKIDPNITQAIVNTAVTY